MAIDEWQNPTQRLADDAAGRQRAGRKLWLILAAVAGVTVFGCCGFGGVIAFLASRTIHQLTGTYQVPDSQRYADWRRQQPTRLIKQGAAPQGYEMSTPPSNVSAVTYPSGSLQLQAWVYRPDREEPRPALIFLHGGFAFGPGDFQVCTPACERDFVVMTPMLRGENGNPGQFELFRGEVDDAKAAAVWLAAQPYVDRERVYVFGHSVGGGVSAMLSLLDNVPIRHSGSSGGLYPPATFLGWSDIIPFENTPKERAARLLLGNIKHMQRPHYAYLGQTDDFQDAAEAARAEAGDDSLLTVEMVPGDHFTSFDESLARYLELIESE